MTDEIAQLLKTLHLTRIATILDEELAHADQQDLGYQELLAGRVAVLLEESASSTHQA